jgi:hypothetical protein
MFLCRLYQKYLRLTNYNHDQLILIQYTVYQVFTYQADLTIAIKLVQGSRHGRTDESGKIGHSQLRYHLRCTRTRYISNILGDLGLKVHKIVHHQLTQSIRSLFHHSEVFFLAVLSQRGRHFVTVFSCVINNNTVGSGVYKTTCPGFLFITTSWSHNNGYDNSRS